MLKINFTKMSASGNDFVIVEKKSLLSDIDYRLIAESICDRKYGVGADGLLLLEKSKTADIKMRIFNADGSEAQMCGNGARCAALYVKEQNTTPKINIETKAGIIKAEVNNGRIKIKLTAPKELRLNIPVKINNRTLHVNFINTGVPHTVIFVDGIDKIEVDKLGRFIRYHQRFKPAGTNVNFVEFVNSHLLRVRTYERGVEGETLACGTGAVASALIFALKSGVFGKIEVKVKSGDVLNVYFKRVNNSFQKVWLEGQAKIIFTGEFFLRYRRV